MVQETHPIHLAIGQVIFGKKPYKKSFFWTLLGIMFFETKEGKVDDGRGGKQADFKKTMVFPRYHQLDAVSGLINTAKNEKVGLNYLIQHSAGSGKTNSISWLPHRLASLHKENDEKIY